MATSGNGPHRATRLIRDFALLRALWLGEVEEGNQLADADLAGVLAEDVHQLHADRIAERLGHNANALGLLALDVRIDDGLATGLARRALLLRCEL